MSVVLALLLVLGAWGATHIEPEASSAAGVTESVADPSAVSDTPAVTEASGAVGFGLAACLLGALCGLLLIVSFLRLRGRRPPGIVTAGTRRVLWLVRASSPERHSTPLTLSQLSISRT
ncbi:hypothetical protein GCM10022219_20490 [Microbacterium oryzae]|uniref:Uncharacterized protein n=1 Tax=Microbacterium oryzae TaxID=743009 RepID=A0A6I6DRY5_9MICO|nr:hypothetical protein [Microbacterium oryzae]QGU27702.1 hypothetical protein D7D94_08485 [Microbacterium oryzae]